MANAPVIVDVIDDVAQFATIKSEWDDLQNACPHKHVLLDWRFNAAWWKFGQTGASMRTLVLRRAGQIIGIVPLALSQGWEVFPTRGKNVRIAADYQHLPRARWRRWMYVRRLGFPLSFASSNIRAHPLAADYDAAMVAAVMDYCASIRHEWDILSLDGIPASSTLADSLAAAGQASGLRRGLARHSRDFMSTALPDSMSAFMAARSRNFRRSMRRAKDQAVTHSEPNGGFRVVEYGGARIDEGLDYLFLLETQSWKAQDTRNRDLHLRLDDRQRQFHRTVANEFASQDAAQVLVSWMGDTPVNALYSLTRQSQISCVLTYQASASARHISLAPLWYEFFSLAIERRITSVDLNGNNDYLARYANQTSTYSREVYYHSRPYSRLLAMLADSANRLAQLV